MNMLNCPFCNNRINKVETDLSYDDEVPNYIRCEKCLVIMFGTAEEGKRNLIRKWNKRHGC